MNKEEFTNKEKFTNYIKNELTDEMLSPIATKKNRISQGSASNYPDLFWGMVKLTEPLCGYTHVLLMPYQIKQSDLVRIVSHGVKANNGIRLRDRAASDYDSTTGNTHPSMNRVAEEIEKGGVRQLVLVNYEKGQYGPILTEEMSDYDGPFIEELLPDVKVPAFCYYP